MHFLLHDKKPFISSILKHKLSHTDKSNPDNIAIPDYIENIKDRKLNQIIEKILKKYKQKNYTLFSREELNSQKNWLDIHFLILFMFYKKIWHISIKNEDLHFPHFLSTYNFIPLHEEVDKVVSKVYDKINSKATQEELKNNRTFTALDLTYLLYYLTIEESTFNNKES